MGEEAPRRPERVEGEQPSPVSPPLERPLALLARRLRQDRALSRWLVLRIALPFPISGAVLAASAVLVAAPAPFTPWMRLCATAGVTLGLAALVGLWLARRPPAQRLTLWLAAVALPLLGLAYLLGADPFCWRGQLVEGLCHWR